MQQLWSDATLAEPSDHDICRSLICSGSKSFFAASLVLPKPVCRSAYALYAFCRVADDAVDLKGGKLEAVERLRMRLDRAYDARPLPDPVDRALACVVHRHALPRELPEALIEGLEWDARGRRYDDLSGIFDYSARVAGAVGAMMSVLMGVRSADALARACDLGVAMQLTNIARDVAEDAAEGRLYLPRAWLHEAGVDPDTWLREPVFDGRIRGVVRRLLRHADELYDRARTGIDLLPLACRPGIHAARRIYAEIGRVLEAQDCNPSSGRAYVRSGRKANLLGQALLDALHPAPPVEAMDPLSEVRFLIDAVLASPPRPAPRVGLAAIVNTIEVLQQRDYDYWTQAAQARPSRPQGQPAWIATSS